MDQKILPLSDSSALIHFGDEISLDVNRRVHALDARLRRAHPDGIVEAVPAYATLLVHYDPLALTFDEVAAWLKEAVEDAQEVSMRQPRHIEVPVRYGSEAGPDLGYVASFHHVTPAEIVRLHTGREYTVFMMGFTPGFPYMGILDEAIATPRLETPRTRVPAGSVGIAGTQTGIYPIDSPGGWRLIGYTSLPLFDLAASEPFLLAPGDTVRFIAEAIDA